MFNIKQTIKYLFFVLAIVFALNVSTANASGFDGYYGGTGYGDSYDYYYSEPAQSNSYVDNSNYYYVEPTQSYQSSYYYQEPTTYSYPSASYDYSYPTYYDYSLGCSSCSYGNYSYPQTYYVPSTPVYTPAPVTPVVNTLDASCVISPNNVYVNDSVTISANVSGGNGNYTYYWSGSDGISGSSQVITGRFTSSGSKTVSLTVTSNNQSVTRTCSAYVNQNNNYYYNSPTYYNNNLTATCSANSSNANVGDNVVWTVYPNGGIGSYTYSWNGSDNLSYGNAYQIQQRYLTSGYKTATVTVYSTNGQTVTATCNTNIAGSTINGGTPISGVYLNEVPATGIEFNTKVALYILGLVLWSAFIGFIIVERKKSKLAIANRGRIEDFKQENLRKKGIL